MQWLYTIHFEYFDAIDDHNISVSKLSILTLIIGLVSLLMVFIVNEIVHWQEIRYLNPFSLKYIFILIILYLRANVRYQKRARLDFGTKLGMNSPF